MHKSRRPPGPLDHISAYATATQLFGKAISEDDLLERISRYSWSSSSYHLARIACLSANHEEGLHCEAVRALTVGALQHLPLPPEPRAHLRQVLNAFGDRIVVAHEEGLRMLQHAVLAYGAHGNDAPDIAIPELALWLACANEYLGRWAKVDDYPLSELETSIADQAHGLRFNNRPDWLRDIARTYEIYRQTPQRNRFSDPDLWARVQEQAFGSSFQSYFERFLAPLTFLSTGWGSDEPGGAVPSYTSAALNSVLDVRPDEASRWIAALTSERETIKASLAVAPRQLPHAPLALLHKPFLSVGTDEVLPTSASALRQQLKTGVWAKLMHASKETLGSEGPETWTSTFGDLFERWCRRVARAASQSLSFRGKVLLSEAPGDVGEVEDVVVLEGNAAVLFSVKSSLVVEEAARKATSRTALISWYEKFFFAKPDARRGGALRQLSARIDLIQQGKFEPNLPRKTKLLPVLVTYDSLCEDGLLYRWLEEKCIAEGLLLQERVAPLTIARIDDFETLLALGAAGDSIVGILRRREKDFKHRRLDSLLHYQKRGKTIRLRFVSDSFNELRAKVLARIPAKPAAE